MATIVSAWLSDELADALNAWAAALGRSRSAVLRALIEDALDAGELPTASPTAQELLDVEFERLRELSRS